MKILFLVVLIVLTGCRMEVGYSSKPTQVSEKSWVKIEKTRDINGTVTITRTENQECVAIIPSDYQQQTLLNCVNFQGKK